MNRRGIVTVTAFAVVVAGLVTMGVAHARTHDEPALTAPNAAAHASLVLTVSAQGGTPKTASLECDPPGGSHPHAEEACASLAAADGQIDAIKPTPGEMCPNLVAPVRATAAGRYGSTPINYDHTWNNPCEMTRATGEVFDF